MHVDEGAWHGHELFSLYLKAASSSVPSTIAETKKALQSRRPFLCFFLRLLLLLLP
jgi:hypothetical protein